MTSLADLISAMSEAGAPMPAIMIAVRAIEGLQAGIGKPAPPPQSELDAAFEEFYAAYPKHVDPRAARSKFAVIVKSGVPASHIITAAKRYAEAHRIAGTDKQYIRAPEVWLNRGGYDSEDLPAPRRNDNRPRTVMGTLNRIANGHVDRVDDLFTGAEIARSAGRTIEGVAVAGGRSG